MLISSCVAESGVKSQKSTCETFLNIFTRILSVVFVFEKIYAQYTREGRIHILCASLTCDRILCTHCS